MVKSFKGIVKISDVQTEFDNLIFSINNSIDSYNNINNIRNIDYTKAGSSLAPLGYTLTVGGLKQFMSLYNGYCFGCKVFKVGTNKCKPTGGILVTTDKLYRIPEDTVNGYGTKLFYDPKTNKCLVGGTTKVTKTIAIPAATSNNNPWKISTNYNQGNAWKGVNYKHGKNDSGWDIGGTQALANENYVAVLQNKQSTINRNKCARWITLTYPTTLTYPKGKARLCVQLRTDVNIDKMLVLGAVAVGFNGSSTLKTYPIFGGDINDDDGVTAGYFDSQCISLQIALSKNKAISFKSITFGIIGLQLLYHVDQPPVRRPARLQGIGVYNQNPTTTVTVVDNDTHDDVYEIADLNWEKTTGDKLWLNDLPHSMYAG